MSRLKKVKRRGASKDIQNSVPEPKASKPIDDGVLAKIELSMPLIIGNRKYESLTLRIPVAGDLWAMPDDKLLMGHFFDLAAKLANVEPFVIRNLNGHDAWRLLSTVQHFLLHGREQKEATLLQSSATQGTALDSVLNT